MSNSLKTQLKKCWQQGQFQNAITPRELILCHCLLDLGYVSMHLYKGKIKFDDWKCFENYLQTNKGYLFKFDFGYHHIGIFDSHQTYLGFSWDIKGATEYFVFTDLPFGLSSAPFAFTKVVRPLVKHWRLHAVFLTIVQVQHTHMKMLFLALVSLKLL